MPSLVLIKIVGNMIFFAEGKELPTKEWKEKYYKDRKQVSSDQGNAPKTIPPWFKAPHATYKYQQDPVDKIGKDFKEFHDTMLDAVKDAHDMWRLKAQFKDLKINALTALGSKGCLDGKELESDIKNMASGMDGNMKKHRDAVAKGVSKCFKSWQDSVMITGLPLYPAFVAFPLATAPPMPNIPVPLIACISADMTKICMPDDMAKAMSDALDGGLKKEDKDKQYEALHKAIATVLSIGFLIWLASQQVMLVLGKGPIPSYAPPFVPVGPVVMGENVKAPNLMV